MNIFVANFSNEVKGEVKFQIKLDAFGIGLFLDLVLIRHIGYTGLVFTIFVFLIRLYERKFETQTATFVFFAAFLGSIFYLKVFGHSNILAQSLVSSLMAILFFRFLCHSERQRRIP